MDNSVYYIWLSLALGPESNRYSTLFARFGTAKNIYDHDDFSSFDRLTEKQIHRLEDKDLEKPMAICAECHAKGYGILTFQDEYFPERLRIITSPPPVLYYRGNLKNLNGECLISVVGTRAMTDYGRQVTRQFARAFAASGAVVVSGMAAGVDGEAHRGCLDENGFTVAVLGTGIDRPYPRENESLYYDIIERGLVISEFYPGSAVTARNFPVRNRIISGISSATVVTEAGETSGALITARLAVMQGKDVYALPGLTGSEQSAGTNSLLQKGVSLAYRPSDVLSKLELLYPDKIRVPAYAYRAGEIKIKPKSERRESFIGEEKPAPKPVLKKDIGALEPAEQAIIEALEDSGGLIPDAIIAKTGLDAGDVMSSLTVLELYGVIAEDAGGKYKLL